MRSVKAVCATMSAGGSRMVVSHQGVACRIEVLNLTVEASPRAVCAVIDSLVENYFYSLFYIASHVLFCISLNLVYKFSLQYKVSEVSRLFSISAT